ncbi:hypothetical protein AM1BK_32770 [Neobacillus kokaensis]|uniref:Uncharacterized protein n=1 Tax=Neobacillus kokaensis TaxID=2759023 RepID=A0ABQ3N480_9BACI|nr:hypothetical protein AM1BK_32770 [Neobacillus kokaensis]
MLSDIGILKMGELYNLYVRGKAKEKDPEVGILLIENQTPEELYDAVENIIAINSELGKKRETFYKFLKRTDKD